jgi:hypothetical protein
LHAIELIDEQVFGWEPKSFLVEQDALQEKVVGQLVVVIELGAVNRLKDWLWAGGFTPPPFDRCLGEIAPPVILS